MKHYRIVSMLVIIQFSLLSGCSVFETPDGGLPPEIPTESTQTGDFSTGFTDGYRTGFYDGSFGVTYNNSYPPVDTDGDGMHDNYEVYFGLDPMDANDANGDLDGDLASNVDEYYAGTLLTNPDTDGDGLPDGFEIAFGLNAHDSADAQLDMDGDGVSNIKEYEDNTDPLDSSSVLIVTPSRVGPPGLGIDYWDGINGLTVADLTSNPLFPDEPASSSIIDEFNVPQDRGDNFGGRVRGYIIPPASGEYRFWVSSDDYSQLWLSTDNTQRNKKLIASVEGYTRPADYEKYPGQASKSILLNRGQVYYIEGLYKEKRYGDHFSVEWSGPGVTRSLIKSPYIAQLAAPVVLKEGIIAEYWEGISGLEVTDLTSISQFPNAPTRTEILSELRLTPNIGDNYGVRIRGYISPPATGGYQFRIASDDKSELWLSTDEEPENKNLIAEVDGWTKEGQFDVYPGQISSFVELEADYNYYIEVLFKEKRYSDHLTVEWAGPDFAPTIITAVYQLPIEGEESYAPSTELPTEPAEDQGSSVENIGATGGEGSVSTVIVSASTVVIGSGGSSHLASWSIPTQRADGSGLALSEIDGYEITLVREGGGTTIFIIGEATTTELQVSGLVSGEYSFSIKAIDTNGLLSAASQTVTLTVL